GKQHCQEGNQQHPPTDAQQAGREPHHGSQRQQANQHCYIHVLLLGLIEKTCARPGRHQAMMPPPRQISPSYSTADWPGVTAHWGWLNDSPKSVCVTASMAQAASAWR